MQGNTIQIFVIVMELVVTDLIHDIDENKQGAGHTDHETEYVDCRKELVLQDAPDGDLKIVLEHGV